MRLLRYVLFFAVLLVVCDFSNAQSQRGKATYYGKRSHGRITASGEKFHRDSFTCAHRTLPFGTILKVRDTKTDKEVYVRVTDRGPFLRGRVIDLSYAAAKELGIVTKGVTNVEISQCNNLVGVPYRRKDVDLPTLQVRDPLGNGYCDLAKWGERYNKAKLSEAMARSEKRTKAIKKAKQDSVPRWRVLNQLTAQGNATYPADHQMIIVK